MSDDVRVRGITVLSREDREYQLRTFVPWLAARRAERRISQYEAFQVRPVPMRTLSAANIELAPFPLTLAPMSLPQVIHGESHLPEEVEQALCAELVKSDRARRREQSLGQPPRALPTIGRTVVGVNIAVPLTDATLARLLAHLQTWPLPSHWIVGPFRLLVRPRTFVCLIARRPVIHCYHTWAAASQLEHNVPRRSHAVLTGQAVTVTLAAYRIGAVGLVAEVRLRFPNR